MNHLLQEFRAKVERGALHLDVVSPGWHQRINLNELEMDSGCNCVLGQLYGVYGRGVDRICPVRWRIEDLEWSMWSAAHGFCSSDGDWRKSTAEALEQLWHEEIARRTEADLAATSY